MIKINEKPFAWFENMSIFDLLKTMGYTLKRPAVLITVNNEVIRKSDWDNFLIQDSDVISVLNLLRGG